jgi:hypothetical protein
MAGYILVSTISEREQAHILANLFKWGCVALPLVLVAVNVVKEYRGSRDWKAWLQLVAFLVLYGGVWSWFGYFGDHGAFFTWPIIVLVVFFLLLWVHRRASDNRQKEYAERMRNEFPEPPNMTAGPSNLRDFEDWK